MAAKGNSKGPDPLQDPLPLDPRAPLNNMHARATYLRCCNVENLVDLYNNGNELELVNQQDSLIYVLINNQGHMLSKHLRLKVDLCIYILNYHVPINQSISVLTFNCYCFRVFFFLNVIVITCPINGLQYHCLFFNVSCGYQSQTLYMFIYMLNKLNWIEVNWILNCLTTWLNKNGHFVIK